MYVCIVNTPPEESRHVCLVGKRTHNAPLLTTVLSRLKRVLS